MNLTVYASNTMKSFAVLFLTRYFILNANTIQYTHTHAYKKRTKKIFIRNVPLHLLNVIAIQLFRIVMLRRH